MPLQVYTADGRIKYTRTSYMLVGPVRTVSGNTTLGSSDYFIEVTATATITLPDAAANPGRQYYIKHRGTGITVTINTTSSQLIDDDLTLSIDTRNVCVGLISDGAGWLIK